jgi:hypothetical protein
VQLAIILILQLDEATPATSIAEALPFLTGHVFEPLGPPEWLGGIDVCVQVNLSHSHLAGI